MSSRHWAFLIWLFAIAAAILAYVGHDERALFATTDAFICAVGHEVSRRR